MKGFFEMPNFGRCYIGTYAIRNLCKQFGCEPGALLVKALEPGMSLEFTSYLLKFSFENALIQEKGAAGYKEKHIFDVDKFMDENEKDISSETYEKMNDALWLSVIGMTAKEWAEKNKDVTPEEGEENEKKNTTLPTGVKSKKRAGTST